MDLHVLSWNVNGLRSARLTRNRQDRVGTELRAAVNKPVDILMLQEHTLARPVTGGSLSDFLVSCHWGA